MKKFRTILFLLGLCVQAVAGDTLVFNKTLTLDSDFSTYDSVVVAAVDSIIFEPGFSYFSGSEGGLVSMFPSWNLGEPDETLTMGTTVESSGILDGGYLVGSISGQAGVSPSGGGSYTIPIEVPTGTRGMAPQLSVVYNSQSGNGIMGRGWNVGGLSSIMATGKVRYYDNETTAISSAEALCRVVWDGQRLLALNNTGLEADSFRLEMVTNHKIIRHGSDDTIWFEVRTPDGRIMEYGHSTDSRLNLGSSTQWKWMLSKVYDRDGNSIIYSYTTDTDIGEILLDEISYGGTTGSHSNTISFHYTDRSDISYGYIHTDLVLNDQLLDSISMESAGAYYGSYGFQYDNTLDESLLEEIVKYDKDNYRYNSTSVSWEAPTFNINATSQTKGILSGGEYHQYSGDFTGDGISDLVVIEMDTLNDEYTYRLYEGSSSGLQTISPQDGVLPRSYTGIYWDELKTLYNGSNCGGTASTTLGIRDVSYVFSGDFDGDGIEELFVKTVEWDALVPYLADDLNQSFSIYSQALDDAICNYSSFLENPTTDSMNMGIGRILNLDEAGTEGYTMKSFYLGQSSAYDKQLYQFPDLDGLGYNCIPDADSIFYYHSDLDTMLAFCPIPDNPIRWGEFNGDGKADYIYYDDDGTWKLKKYLGTTAGFLLEESLNGDYLGMIDLNGDGINAWVGLSEEQIQTTDAIDLWYSWCQSCDWGDPDDWEDFLDSNSDIETSYDNYCNNNCGDDDNDCREYFIYDGEVVSNQGFELYAEHLTDHGPKISFGNFTGTHTPYSPMFTRAIAVDINADNSNDLLVFNGDTLKYIYYDFEPSYTSGNLSYTYSTKTSNTLLDHNMHFGDFNGDGIVEMIFPDRNKELCFVTSGQPGRLVSGVSNGLGVESRYTYKPLTDNSVYTKESDATLPVIDFSAPWYVVSSVASDNGVADSSYVEYEYQGAKVHMQGKGFLGFMKTTVENNLQNTSQISTFDYDNTFYQTYPDSTRQYSGETLMAESRSYSNISNLGAHRFRLKTDTVISEDVLKNITTTTRFSYNDDGLVEEKVSDVDGAATITEKYSYTSAGWHVAASPEYISKEYKRGTPTATDSTYLTYSTSSGNLIQKKVFCGTDREVVTRFSDYDSFGNPRRISTTGKRGQSLSTDSVVTTMSYSSDGRYLLSKHAPLDHDKRYEYDYTSGVVETQIGTNRQETIIEYGAFNRKKKITHPDYVEEVSILAWSTDHDDMPTGSLFYKWSAASGTPEVLTFYDEVGRELRTVTKGFGSDLIYNNTEYDSKGRVSRKSLPYFSTETALWTTYTYDSYGRISTQTTPDTTVTTYTYDDTNRINTVEVQKGSNSMESSQKSNTLGEITESEDNLGNKVKNEYYPDGKLKASSVGSDTTSFTYDAQGNRATIKDPDAGTITSLYDAFGGMLRQINAKGDTSIYLYDDLGRVTKQTDARGDIFYSYISDTTNAAFGMVNSVYNSDHSLQEVTAYDSDFGRLISQTNTQSGKTFTNTYTYDWFGRLFTRTYPSGFEVLYTYTSNGDLNQVIGNGLTLWDCSEVNELGQVTGYSQGSNSTTVTYNVYGELSKVEAGPSASIMNMSYGFDDFGNLTYREDVNTDQKEEFTYDALNRLTEIEYYKYDNPVPGVPTLTMVYDNTGNITSKTNLSTDIDYGEGDAGPHALTTINDPVSSYTPPPQLISYNCFNKVSSITDTLTGGTPLTIDFTYGLNNQRIRTTKTRNSSIERVKYFDMDYEEDSTSSGVKKYHYIHGGNGITAIFVKQGTGNDTMFYVLPDHLGSLTSIVNASTSAVTNYSFNAWGIPREADDWTSEYTGELFAGRGFTGHEHLMEFSLINMNGRIYDPILGRFLSPDPYVQMPDYPNNFNRYAYALNNPLIYTDPSGEFIFTLLALLIPGAQFLLPVAIGTDIGWMTGGIRGATTEGSSFIEGAWKGAVVGAVGGGLSMIGGAGMPFITNLALGTGSGALTGGLDAALWDNDIGKGMLWGAAAGAAFTTFTSENFKNMLKGEGFYTNENVFNNMIGRGAGKQEVLDHFKFEGTYDPDNVLFGGGGDPGITDPATGKIFYNDKAFAGRYDDLKLTVHHELRHQHDIFSGKYANIKLTREFKAGEEFATYLHNYKNQGLYPSHTYDLGTRMLTSATQAKLNPDMYFKYIFDSDRPWWHRIYQIPRRW